MSGDLAFLIYPESEVVDQLSKGLHSSGLKVLSMRSESEAEQIIATFKYVLPDVLITPLDDPESNDSILIKLLRANPLMEQVPVVILASGDQEQRRRALRQGLTHMVFPPYEIEEVILTTRLALERDRDTSPLFGSVSQLPVPDLLQTIEVGRRSGSVTLRRRGARGTIWFRDGIIIESELDSGVSGEEAVYDLALWSEGTFEADFSPIAIPGRLSLTPSVMLLEAMKRHDEENRPPEDYDTLDQEDPEEQSNDGAVAVAEVVAAAEVEAPAPQMRLPGDAATFHMALTLLNIASTFALQFLSPRILHRRLETIRQQLEHRYPELRIFQVTSEGLVAIAFDVTVVLQPREVVAATSDWLLEFFGATGRTMPHQLTVSEFAGLTRSFRAELERHGFAEALGLPEVPS